MAYVKGSDRKQVIFFPEAIDDYITEENPVQFIDAYVDSLDLKKLNFKHASTKKTGRPPYNPADLLKLYIYGYLNRTRSSRSLEKEALRNLEVMWLVKKLSPDFKTIADFRKDNIKAIKQVSRQFVLFCKKINLFGAELVSVDGSKFKASNSKDKNFSENKLKKRIENIDKKLDDYFLELEANDKKEEHVDELKADELKEKIQMIKERKSNYEGLLNELKENDDKQISLTDPDARAMKNGQKTEVCYNVQTTVDAKHKLILDHKVTNDTSDQNQLYNMARRAKTILSVDSIEVTADKGYFNTQHMKKCLDNNITPFVPVLNSRREKHFYPKEEFKYIKEKDAYLCPAGETLSFSGISTVKGRENKIYKSKSCKNCNTKAKCTGGSYRRIQRYKYEHLIDEVREKLVCSPGKMKTRMTLSEHPFGTIKRSFNQGYMLTRGLKKAGTEISLSVLTYNIKRALNIVGIKELIAELGQ